MTALGVALCGVLGLFVGSAVWVIGRAQAGRRPLTGDPVCAECQQALPALAWLPLWGLGGARRCRRCGAIQPGLRAVFEVLVAGYFAVAAWRLGASLDLAATLVFTVPLLVILLVDLWTRFIYTNSIAAGLLLGLIFALADGFGSLVNAGGAAVGAAAIFVCFYFLGTLPYRTVRLVPLGLGDVYLATMIGTMVGYPAILPTLFFGILAAVVVRVGLVLIGRVRRRHVLGYGPYLCLGALLTLLFRG